MEWLAGPLVGGLYDYNKENFFFDWEQRLKREFQGQNMRVKQFGLYREDVRDLMGLTVSKMDNYLIVNAFTLGICVMLFTMGRPESGKSEQWVYWLSSMTTASAFFYTLMSMWLAMHASIAAHSFGVRMLTQAVRLPIPTKAQLDAACAVARDYESRNLTDMLRIPVVQQQMNRLAAMDNTVVQGESRPMDAEASMSASDDEGSSVADAIQAAPEAAGVSALKHLKLYRRLQSNWQAYDAYARVSMAMGMNQLLHAVSYFTVRMMISEESSAWPALGCLCILVFAAWLLACLDLFLTPRVLAVAGILLFLPPAFTMAGIIVTEMQNGHEYRVWSDVCAPVSFLMHIAWIYFIWRVAKPTEFNGVALPTNFRSVLYLDVFGWMQREDSEEPAPANEPQLNEDVGMSVLTSGLRTLAEKEAEMKEVRACQARHTARRDQLVEGCRELERELSRVLACWHDSEVLEMMSAPMKRDAESLKRRFESRAFRLARVAGPPEPAAAQDASALWLQLEWNPSGIPIPFWYNTDKKTSVWTLPSAPDVVSTLGNVDTEVSAFETQVEELELHESSDPLQSHSTASLSTRQVQFVQASDQPSETTATAAPAAPTATPATSSTLAPAPVAVDDTESEQFGGTEAIPIEAFCMNECADDADAFHPHARRRASTGNRARRRRPRRAQGKLPWQTFSQGSVWLLGVWSIGLVWCTWRVIDHSIDIIIVPPNATFTTATVSASRVRLEMLDRFFRGPWPHAFFQPKDLICSESGLLVLEEFALRELALPVETLLDDASSSQQQQQPPYSLLPSSSTPSWSTEPLLEDCLAQQPAYHGRGFRAAAAVAAAVGGHSALVVLDATGQQLMHCSSSSSSSSSSSGVGRAVHAEVLPIEGPPWRSLSASPFVARARSTVGSAERSGNSTSERSPAATGLSALRTDGSLVAYQLAAATTAGAASGETRLSLVPLFQFPASSGSYSDTERAVLLGRRYLLRLYKDGLLEAQDLRPAAHTNPQSFSSSTSSSSSSSSSAAAAAQAASRVATPTTTTVWSRRLGGSSRWSGLCVDEERRRVYLAGRALRRAGEPPLLARFDLPEDWTWE